MSKYAVFTIDVEAFSDTECISNLDSPPDIDIVDGFERYMEILDRHGIKGTLFTVGTFAPKISDTIIKYSKKGHSIALHSYDHKAPMLQSLDDFREKTARAKNMLEDMFNTEVTGFRAPCFSMDNSRLEILRELGFKYDSSHLGFPARHTADLDLSGFREYRRGVFENHGFYEFSMSAGRFFGKRFPVSGGGYVRLSNWNFISVLIRRFIRKNDYYVFYLHPFELTRKKIPFIRELKSYDKFYTQYGIKSYARKVERIIKMLKKCGYEFVTFEQLMSITERQKFAKINIDKQRLV